MEQPFAKTALLFPAESHLVASLLHSFPLLVVADNLLLDAGLDDVAFLKALVAIFKKTSLGFDRAQVPGQLIGQLEFEILKVNIIVLAENASFRS
jgi:hypothetical protein